MIQQREQAHRVTLLQAEQQREQAHRVTLLQAGQQRALSLLHSPGAAQSQLELPKESQGSSVRAWRGLYSDQEGEVLKHPESAAECQLFSVCALKS